MANPLRVVPSREQAPLPGRERVWRAFERAAKEPIVLVQAAAGAGKSTAVGAYLERSGMPHARVAIEPGTTSLTEVILNLALALGNPWAKTVAAAVVGCQQAPDPAETLARWLASNGRPDRVIVLEDLHHCASNSAVWSFITYAVAICGRDLHWILTSRGKFNLPVATWTMAGLCAAPVDDAVLTFNVAEIAELAKARNIDISPLALRSIEDLTKGWAGGVLFALLHLSGDGDVANAAFKTRELTYHYFAEQYFNALSADERRVLFALALSPDTDMAVLDDIGCERPAKLLENLATRIALIQRLNPETFTLQDVFQGFLLTKLAEDDDSRRSLASAIASALEARGNLRGALRLFVAQRQPADVLRILVASGLTLLDEGDHELVKQGLALQSRTAQHTHPHLLAIRAALAKVDGDFDQAILLFNQALTRSDDEHRYDIASRLALLRLNRWDGDVYSLLGPYLDAADPRHRCEALAITAIGSTIGREREKAREAISSALAMLPSIQDQHIHAKTLWRAAIVSFYTSDVEHVEEYALKAAALAKCIGDMETASGAYSVLHAHAYANLKNYAVALQYARQMQQAGERSGNDRPRAHALRAQYALEALRGREDQLDGIDALLSESHSGFRDTLPYLQGKAMRYAWHGSFSEAIASLQSFDAGALTPAEHQLHDALVAFYSIAAGDIAEGEARLRACDPIVTSKSLDDEQYVLEMTTFIVLSLVLLGRPGAGRKILTAARAPAYRGDDRALGQALHRLTEVRDKPAFALAAKTLASGGFGGLARTLDAITAAEAVTKLTERLTPTELLVLQAIDVGRSPREIAHDMGRAYETIRGHVKEITRKLNVGGMREAVVAAHHMGLLQDQGRSR
jgi:ATP/maltotriose-dependent transcriptional regulator MalT